MPVPTYEEARRIIAPSREASVAWAVHAAWQDWETCPARGKYSRWPRTRACMVFERLADRLVEAFTIRSPDTGVRFVFADETIKVVFDEKIVLRLKKSNVNGLGSNITTQAVMDFVEAQRDIPGLEGLLKLEGVYVLNRLQTAVADVLLLARDGDMKFYSYSISDSGEGQGIIDFPPAPPRAPEPQDGGYDAGDLVLPRPPAEGGKGSKPGQT